MYKLFIATCLCAICISAWQIAQINVLRNRTQELAQIQQTLKAQMDTYGDELTKAELPQVRFAEETLIQPSGLTVAQLESKLLYDLKPYAAAFLQAEADTGINAVFLASVAALESGWGRDMCAPNNIYGWTGASGFIAFESVPECIAHVAKFLEINYLTKGGMYYNGVTVDAVNVRYNGRAEWAVAVRQIMAQI